MVLHECRKSRDQRAHRGHPARKLVRRGKQHPRVRLPSIEECVMEHHEISNVFRDHHPLFSPRPSKQLVVRQMS